ncbi:hypothetical protein SynWH8103_00331 [Synechococcus sp. WH 8103]|nr:hypothetical protein SynWH8103_00331 [Synechococcus sp. WH 8103]
MILPDHRDLSPGIKKGGRSPLDDVETTDRWNQASSSRP